MLAALPTWYGLLVSTVGQIVLHTLHRHRHRHLHRHRIGATMTETLVRSEARA